MKKLSKIICMLFTLLLLCSCSSPNDTVQGDPAPDSDNTYAPPPYSSNGDSNISNTDNTPPETSDSTTSENAASPLRTYSEYDDIFNVINGNADIAYGTFPPEASSADGSMTVITLNGLTHSGSTLPSATAVIGSTEYNINSGVLIISKDGTTVSETPVFTDSYTVGGENDNEQAFAYGYENASSVSVSGNRLAIVTSSHDYTETYDEGSKAWSYGNKRMSNVYIYDISDLTAPMLVTKLSQDGELASSIFSEGRLYIVSSWFVGKIYKDDISTYVPHTYSSTAESVNAENIYVFEYSTCAGYTILAEYDIENGIICNASALLGGSGRLYIDESDIYAVFFSEAAELSTSYIENNYKVEEYSEHCMSAIAKFPISEALSSPCFALVNGCFGNDFSIYTKDNTLYFCAVAENSNYAVYTDPSSSWTSKKDISAQVENVLYTLSSDLTEVNSVYLPNEEISSARFDGDTVWIGYFSGEQGFDIHTGQPVSSENS